MVLTQSSQGRFQGSQARIGGYGVQAGPSSQRKPVHTGGKQSGPIGGGGKGKTGGKEHGGKGTRGLGKAGNRRHRYVFLTRLLLYE